MIKAMKQRDFEPCIACKRGVMHGQSLIFYRVEIAAMGIDLGAVQRQHGLEMMMGKAAILAQVMGPDEDLATPLSQHSLTVCLECWLTSSIGALYELAVERDEATEQTEEHA